MKNLWYALKNFRLNFIGISILLIINLPCLSASLVHNWGMLRYQQLLFNEGSDSEDWEIVVNKLQSAIALNANDASASLRLARLFTQLGEYEVAQDYTRAGLTALGKPICYIEQQDFARLIAVPIGYIPNKLLDFVHPQSAWRFEPINVSSRGIVFKPKDKDKGCIAQIVVEHDLAPDQFIWLWQEVKIEPNRIYQFSAIVRSTGMERAWLGIKSQWTGTPIVNNQKWHPISYKFYTKANQMTEVVQFVIEAGNGVLEIDHVKLEIVAQ